jgi:hypothetical protein
MLTVASRRYRLRVCIELRISLQAKCNSDPF